MRRSIESSDFRKMNNLHQRVSLLRRSEDGSVFGSGSILNDDTDADWNKRESQWWKRLDKEHTRTNFLSMNHSHFENSEISVEESHTIKITLVDDTESDHFSMSSVNSLPVMSPIASARQRGLFKRQLPKRNIENKEMADHVYPAVTSDAGNANTVHVEQRDDTKSEHFSMSSVNSLPVMSPIASKRQRGLFKRQLPKRNIENKEMADRVNPAVTSDAGNANTVHVEQHDDTKSEHFSMSSVNSLPVMSPIASKRQRGLFKRQLPKRNIENKEMADHVYPAVTSDAGNANTLHVEQLLSNFLPENSESEKNSNIDSLYLRSKIEIPLKSKHLFKNRKSLKKMAFSQAIDNSSKIMDGSEKNNDNESSLNLKKLIVKPSKKLFKKSSKLKKSLFAEAWSNLESDDSKIEEYKKSKVISINNTNIFEKELGNTNSGQQHGIKHHELLRRRASRGSANNSHGRISEQDVDSVKSGYPDFSPSSFTSETINFDRWKRLASSTMLENDRSPKTSNKSKQAVSVKLDLLPSAIMEEKEISVVSSSKAQCQENNEYFESSKYTAAMGLPIDSTNPSNPVRESTKINLLISPVKNKTNDSINQNSSKRLSKVHKNSQNCELFKDNEFPDAVRNMEKPSSHESHAFQDVFFYPEKTKSPHLEATILPSNSPNLQKRQSIGTWLRLQGSDEELSPTLSQSIIDRQVIEELMAKRTNPPVRRSSHFENQHFDNTKSEYDSTDVEMQQKGEDISIIDRNGNGILTEKQSVETEDRQNLLTADKPESRKKFSQASIIDSSAQLIAPDIGESGNSVQVVTEKYVNLQHSQQGINGNVVGLQLSQQDITEKEKIKADEINLQTSQQNIIHKELKAIKVNLNISQENISDKNLTPNEVNVQKSQQNIADEELKANKVNSQASQQNIANEDLNAKESKEVNLQTIQQNTIDKELNVIEVNLQMSQQNIANEELKANEINLQMSQQNIAIEDLKAKESKEVNLQTIQQNTIDKELKAIEVNLQMSQQNIANEELKENEINLQMSQQNITDEELKTNAVTLQMSQQNIKINEVNEQKSQQNIACEELKENEVTLQTSQQNIACEELKENEVTLQTSQQNIKINEVNVQKSQQNITDEELKTNAVTLQMSQQNIKINEVNEQKSQQNIACEELKENEVTLQTSQQNIACEELKENEVTLQTSQQNIKINEVNVQKSQQNIAYEELKENEVTLQTSQQNIKINEVNLQKNQQNIIDIVLKANEVNLQTSQQTIVESNELKRNNTQDIENINLNLEPTNKILENVQIFSESSDIYGDEIQQRSRIFMESINIRNNSMSPSTVDHSVDPSVSIDEENLFIFVENQRKGEVTNEISSVNQETLYSSSDSLDNFQNPIPGSKHSFTTIDKIAIDSKSLRSPVKKSTSHSVCETSQDSSTEVHQVTSMTPTTRFRLKSISLQEILTNSNYSANFYDNESIGSTPETQQVKTNKNPNIDVSIKRKITEEELDELTKKVMFENAKRMKRADEIFTKRFDNEFKKPMPPYLAQKIVQRKQKPLSEPNIISKPNIVSKRSVLKNTEVKVFKKPKLYMKEQWVTQKLYNFVENKLKLKYGLKSLARAEKFIKDLAGIVNVVVKSKTDHHHYVNTLKMEMARLHLVVTHYDFYRFIHEFLPFYFRIKSIPAEGRDVPEFTGRVFSPILKNKNK